MSVLGEVAISQAALSSIIFSVSYGKKNIYLFILATLSIISIGYLMLMGPVIYLVENQILYIYSTSAQAVAGLYGLTLAGFTFFESKLKNIVLDDETYYDHIESLEIIYYRDISTIGIITIIAILMCIFCLSSYLVVFNNQLYINILLTITMSFVSTAIISIVQFSIKLLDPYKLNQIGKKIKASIEKPKPEKVKNIETSNSILLRFMKNYNELEATILNFAQELENLKVCYENREKKIKPRILDALKTLNYNEILNSRDIEIINMLRQYRNVIVHGNDFNIDESILQILETYNQGMMNIFNAKENIDSRLEAYKDMQEKVDKLLSK